MKKYLRPVVVFALLFVIASPGWSVPLGRSNEPMDYLLKTPSLNGFTAGAYFGLIKQTLRLNGAVSDLELQASRVTGYVGYELFRGFSVYVIGGANEVELSGTASTDSEAVFGGGFSVNLLNHFFREPVPMEDAIRINAGAQFLTTKAGFGGIAAEWDEITAAVTVSLVNHTDGNKYYTPESIAIYAGPAFSYLRSKHFESKGDVGVTGGLEIFFTDSMAIDLRVEQFDSISFSAGVNYRF